VAFYVSVFKLSAFVSLACAAENVNELMTNDLLDVCACGFEIFSGVKLIRMLSKELSDGTGHSEAEVRVDIDLTNGKLSSMTELFFGNADSIGHLAAVGVNHLNVILRNGRRTVENDGEVRQSVANLFKNVKTECGRNEDTLFVSGALLGLEFVSAVRGTDSDCKRVNAGLGNEFFNFLRLGVGLLTVLNLNFILDAGKSAELAFNNYAVVVCVFNYLSGNLDIFLKGKVGTVDHNGSKATVDASLAGFKVRTVVKVKYYGDVGAFMNSRLNKLYKVGVVSVCARTLRNLKNNGSVFFLAGFGDTLYDFHVVYVERADSVAVLVSHFKHLFASYKCHLYCILQKF